MLKMVDALEKSLDADIQGLVDVDDTKKQAKVKLEAIRTRLDIPTSIATIVR